MTNVDDFLKHYGVKGMKWGVRKENSVGTPKKTRTDSEEEIRKKKIIRNVAIGAATVAALGISAYAYHRYDQDQLRWTKEVLDVNKLVGEKLKELYSDEVGDRIIPKGTEFIRKSTADETGILKRTYAMRSSVAKNFQDNYGEKTFRITTIADIKMASFNSKVKIASEYLDKETREDLTRRLAKGSLSARKVIKNASREDIGYSAINDMMDSWWKGERADKFMKALKDHGYSAVVDDNANGLATVIFDNAKVSFESIK